MPMCNLGPTYMGKITGEDAAAATSTYHENGKVKRASTLTVGSILNLVVFLSMLVDSLEISKKYC